MDFATKGIVIREVLQGENDKLLTILTPDKGKITAYAKGVKKISSKNAPACQLFVFSEYEFINKSGKLAVKTAVSKDLFYDMRADMTRYSLACYFAEILQHTCMENNDESESLRLFLNCLYALSYRKEFSISQIKAAFEMKLMCICGFMPDFDTCIQCSGEITCTPQNIFSFEESGLICEKCLALLNKNNVPFSCTISHNVIEAIKFICFSQQSKLLMFSLDDDELNELSFVCENYLIHKTERNYETLKIYKSILNLIGVK